MPEVDHQSMSNLLSYLYTLNYESDLFAEPLLGHSKMYSLAEMYRIEGLKRLAASKFEIETNNKTFPILSDEHFQEDFIRAAKHVCETTINIEDKQDMRKIVVYVLTTKYRDKLSRKTSSRSCPQRRIYVATCSSRSNALLMAKRGHSSTSF